MRRRALYARASLRLRDTNDMKYFNPNGFRRHDDFAVYALAAVDTLITEARRGRSSMLTIGFHLRISGRPARFSAVEAILDRLSALDGEVWVATRRAIASHFAATVAQATTARSET